MLGVAGVVLPIGLLTAPFAIAMGFVGRRRAARGARHGGLAVAGLTLGVVGLVLWAVIIVFVIGGLAVGSGTEIGTGEIVTVPELTP